jgi:hypothetical protein
MIPEFRIFYKDEQIFLKTFIFLNKYGLESRGQTKLVNLSLTTWNFFLPVSFSKFWSYLFDASSFSMASENQRLSRLR